MSHTKNGKHITFWQEVKDDGMIPEPAISIYPYSDTICLESSDGRINLNYDSLNEFINLLKVAKLNA